MESAKYKIKISIILSSFEICITDVINKRFAGVFCATAAPSRCASATAVHDALVQLLHPHDELVRPRHPHDAPVRPPPLAMRYCDRRTLTMSECNCCTLTMSYCDRRALTMRYCDCCTLTMRRCDRRSLTMR